jgi:hypothetical protein
MLLRSGTKLSAKWPHVHDDGECFVSMQAITDKLHNLTFASRILGISHKFLVLKAAYILLNNGCFSRERDYQRILTVLYGKLVQVQEKPSFLEKLIKKLRSLKLSVRRWGALRASVKFLSLHSRAVVTANHPSRIDFSVRD